MLDETALRKPGFTEGHRVQLADGQEWTFPVPILRFYPGRGASGKIELCGGHTFNDEYRALMTEYVQTTVDQVYERWSLKVQIACCLLLENYSLADDDLPSLLHVEFNDETNMEMWQALGPILTAQPPKPSTDGLNTP